MYIVGVVLITLLLLAASFTTIAMHLIFTQVVLYGLGAAMVYSPYIFYLDDWFIKRKRVADGIFWSETGIYALSLYCSLSSSVTLRIV